jgi:hypothetical protein
VRCPHRRSHDPRRRAVPTRVSPGRARGDIDSGGTVAYLGRPRDNRNGGSPWFEVAPVVRRALRGATSGAAARSWFLNGLVPVSAVPSWR